jgi:hypothetical protein
MLADPLPAGVELVGVTASQGTCTGTTAISCALGNLVAGGTATVSVTVHVLETAPDTIVNRATVASDAPDPVMSNDTASATTSVARPADLALTKSVSPDQVDYRGRPTSSTVSAPSTSRTA